MPSPPDIEDDSSANSFGGFWGPKFCGPICDGGWCWGWKSVTDITVWARAGGTNVDWAWAENEPVSPLAPLFLCAAAAS